MSAWYREAMPRSNPLLCRIVKPLIATYVHATGAMHRRPRSFRTASPVLGKQHMTIQIWSLRTCNQLRCLAQGLECRGRRGRCEDASYTHGSGDNRRLDSIKMCRRQSIGSLNEYAGEKAEGLEYRGTVGPMSQDKTTRYLYFMRTCCHLICLNVENHQCLV